MAMKKILVAGKWIYMDADHADRIVQKMAEIPEEIQAKVKKKLAAKETRDRKITREMKERGIGPNSFGNQFAGWVMSGSRQNKKESLPTIDGNPLVYSV